MDLFESASIEALKANAPLADRMRPRTLSDYIGQSSIVGKGRLLRRAIEADQLSSLIFYGPPGTGKTTLAKIIANSTKAHFITLNAVLSGVKDIRDSIAQAKDTFKLYGKRTILFIDEVHRFNKSQQDALLPHVENGVIILIGATTENPYFEVNKALVSRSRIFQLQKLTQDELGDVVQSVLSDPIRGYGKLQIEIEESAHEHLTTTANGDARTLLNALELAVTTTAPDKSGKILLTLEIIEESIQKRAVLYDKDGDAHYDIISAFIKSIRGSDPDAALYWLAKMIYAGEDPRFIFRRMIILASEDIGLADPNALQVVMSASQAYDYIGMPEGRFPLSQACLYLATAPKSNTTLSLFDALRSVEQSLKDEVPNHLKDSSRDREGFGHGEGYLYPHAYRDHWVEQQYLPDEFQGKVFYKPTSEGYEANIKTTVEQRREAQLESMLNYSERETFLWVGGSNGDWEKRTWEGEGEYLLELRKLLLEYAGIADGDLVLDLNGGTGFITSELKRKNTYGGVVSLVHSKADLEILTNLFSEFEEVERPVFVTAYEKSSEELYATLDQYQFTHIVGRNVSSTIQSLKEFIRGQVTGGAILTVSEFASGEGSMLSDFVDSSEPLQEVEKRIYSNRKVKLSSHFLQDKLRCNMHRATFPLKKKFSSKDLEHWFRQEENSLGGRIESMYGKEERWKIKERLRSAVVGKMLDWRTVVEFTQIKKEEN